jgi:ribose transport system substrate-binding protein
MPSGSREISSSSAKDAKVPIIVVDTRRPGCGRCGVRTETFVGSTTTGRQVAGEYLVKATGGKRACISRAFPVTRPGTAPARLPRRRQRRWRHDCRAPANWERDQGFNVFQNMLQAHADIDSVFACSDLMALGALEADRCRRQDRQDQGGRLRRAR